MLSSNGLIHKRIPPHTPEQNAIVERANKTVREELSPLIMTDYQNAQSEISRIVHWYNNERMHSSLNYLTPRDYYRGNPDELLYIREERIGGIRYIVFFSPRLRSRKLESFYAQLDEKESQLKELMNLNSVFS